MTGELHQAIEDLYACFARYPLNPVMEGCPCCVSGADKEALHSKPLRELDGNDLSRYTFKALTTWGDTGDFKHYLPRIFELAATTSLPVDTFVVLGKLDYAQWRTWPGEEQEAITRFLLAWYTNAVKNNTGFNIELFLGAYTLTGEITPLLNRFTISFEDQSFSNYVDLVYCHYNDLTGKKKDFKELDEAATQQLLTWINNNAPILEEGFFYFAEQNEELAERISAVQFFFEKK